MPGPAATTPRAAFGAAWLTGLGWGILSAGATVGSFFIAAVAVGPDFTVSKLAASVPWAMFAVIYAIIIASALAVFPVGPAAALIGWPLYRAAVSARWPYAVAGALAGMTAPALIAAVSAADRSLINLSDLLIFPTNSSTLIVFAWFAFAGAFGGFMAGRVVRRSAWRA